MNFNASSTTASNHPRRPIIRNPVPVGKHEDRLVAEAEKIMMAVLHKAHETSGAATVIEPGSSAGIEDDTVVLTLNDNGMIRECSKTSWTLLGCPSSQLIWKHISMLLPQLVNVPLMYGKQVNPRLSFLSRVGHHFEVTCPDGMRLASEIYFNNVENAGRNYLRVIVRPIA